jgi:methylphosphonate synthase
MNEVRAMAHVLGVSSRDLLGPENVTQHGIHLQRHADAPCWDYPAEEDCTYRVTQLAGDPLHPHTTAIELDVGQLRSW